MFEKKKKEERFRIKEDQTLWFGGLCVVVDTQTGVNYLMGVAAGANAITPLLDAQGKVIVDSL